MKFDFVAPCYFGTESAAAFDFKRIGAENVAVTDGRVSFSGGADILAAANLYSRCAERILIRLASYPAKTFDELFDGVYAIPWRSISPRTRRSRSRGRAFPARSPACRRARAL